LVLACFQLQRDEFSGFDGYADCSNLQLVALIVKFQETLLGYWGTVAAFTIFQYRARHFTGAQGVVAVESILFEFFIHCLDEFEAASNPMLPAQADGVVDHHAECFQERFHSLVGFVLEGDSLDVRQPEASSIKPSILQ
jgi:hypothetical protein